MQLKTPNSNATASRKPEVVQAAILAAARRIFVEMGYEAANMRLIAAESGFSKPTIYAHFGSKEKLFEALIKRACSKFKPAETKLSPGLEARDILMELAECYQQTVLAPHFIELYRLVIAEAKRFPELGTIFYNCGPLASRSALAELLNKLCDLGLIGEVENKQTAAEHFEALILEPIKMRTFLLTDEQISPEDINHFFQSAIDMFLKAYN